MVGYPFPQDIRPLTYPPLILDLEHTPLPQASDLGTYPHRLQTSDLSLETFFKLIIFGPTPPLVLASSIGHQNTHGLHILLECCLV